MQEYKVRLREKVVRTGSVTSFRFSAGERINFEPGQFLELVFDTADRKNRQLNKYLSFSSSPTKDYIEVTKRLSGSEFSGRLNALKENDEVIIKAPLGNCVFKEAYRKIWFLIGGIGITPVISILEFIVEKELNNDAVLLYSNRTENDIAFRQELDRWQRMRPNIKAHYTVSDCEPKDNVCIKGHINKDIMQAKITDIGERVVFIFGPPGMVKAMSGLCAEIGCDKENIKTESFLGYE